MLARREQTQQLDKPTLVSAACDPLYLWYCVFVLLCTCVAAAKHVYDQSCDVHSSPLSVIDLTGGPIISANLYRSTQFLP